MDNKRCSKCFESKAVNEFHVDCSARSGLTSDCKECCAKRAKGKYSRLTKAQRVICLARMVSYRKSDIGKATKNRLSAKYRKRNREKTIAHNKLNNEITRGGIVRGACEVCGTNEHIHGHHDDYDRPLEVRWLCAFHHKQHHMQLKRQTA